VGRIVGGWSHIVFAQRLCAIAVALLTCTQSLAKSESYTSEHRSSLQDIEQYSSQDLRFDSTPVWLTEIRQWVSSNGVDGQLKGPYLQAPGYGTPQSAKQIAVRRGVITHLVTLTSSGDIVLGYLDAKVVLLWRIEGTKLAATAHGNKATRKIWRDQNLEHADLFAKEVSYWTEKWLEHLQDGER